MRFNLTLKSGVKVNIPIVIDREDDWFVAEIPRLGIATQGKTLDEVKENMVDLLKMYFSNPHTPKPKIETLVNANIMISTISFVVPKGVYHNQSRTITQT